MHLAFPANEVATAQPNAEGTLTTDMDDGVAIRFANALANLSQDGPPELAAIDLQYNIPDADGDFPSTKAEPTILVEVPEVDTQSVAQGPTPDRLDQAPETRTLVAKTLNRETPLAEFTAMRMEPRASPERFRSNNGQSDAPIFPDAGNGGMADVQTAGHDPVPEYDHIQPEAMPTQDITPRIPQKAMRPKARSIAVALDTTQGPVAPPVVKQSAPESEQATTRASEFSGQTTGVPAVYPLPLSRLQIFTQAAPESGTRIETAKTDQIMRPVGPPKPSAMGGWQSSALSTVENLPEPNKLRDDAPVSREADFWKQVVRPMETDASARLSPQALRFVAVADPEIRRGPDIADKLYIVQEGTAEPLDLSVEKPRENNLVAPVPLRASEDRAATSLGVLLKTDGIEGDQPAETSMKQGSPLVVPDTRMVQLVPQRADLPQSVVRQLVTTVQFVQGGPVEIALNPVELGKVRLAISNQESGAITVSIMAERPETLALVRRHADQLTQEFHAIGYSDVAYSFEQNGHSESGASPGARKPTQTPPDVTQQEQPAPHIHLVASTGLDLRL